MNSDPFLIALGIIGTRDLTDELLKEVLGMLPIICPDLGHDALDTVRKKLESTVGISMVTGQGLHGGDQEPWLEEIKSSIEWTSWQAYKTEIQTNGFPREVIRVLDEDTDNILDECGNPKTDYGWRVQGLVMGDVQSGKTANYCGLINKAADAGYKIILLLTGMTEELRAQTQERMDSGFVGRDSRAILSGERERKAIGSGRYRSRFANVLTSIDFDFLTKNKDSLRGIPLENINEPVLLVMKKNKTPLQNLISFLDTQMKPGHHQLDLPLLLLDDESDNASVNAKKDEDPATINRLIRDILKRFVKSTYVAYTATPFANVFINPDEHVELGKDLFPNNFIYSLNTPDNYIGAASIFSETGGHRYQLQDLTDAEGVFPYKHKKDWPVQELPESLHDAVQTFLLSCAVRDLREEPLKHRSMLVNVTRFVDVQARIASVLKSYLYLLTEEIKQYLADDDSWHKHESLNALHQTWQKQYAKSQESWDRVRKVLYDSIASVKVLTINQQSEAADRLNYRAYQKSEKGRRVIAVGGLTLSRGLTLEGLCISYFYRNSKAYDTLLQMGRWFGYRPGYDDLCRIWMDPDVQDWFEHLADVVTELKLDIRRMSANRQPPSRFGMRVKSHPDALVVTALNKMRNSKEIAVYVSYSECGAETPFLPNSKDANERNLATLSRFINGLGAPKPVGSKLYWTGVEAVRIGTFLSGLEISNMNMLFATDMSGKERPLLTFINSNKFEKLDSWDVCLPQGSGDALPELAVRRDDGNSENIRPRKRQFERVPEGSDYLKLNKQRLGEIADEMVEFSSDQIEAAKREWEELRRVDPDKGTTIPGYVYRRYRERPLLTLHIIQPQDPTDERKARMMKVEDIEPRVLVGVSLSFPKFPDEESKVENKDDKVLYQLNKVALRNMGLIDEDDDDDQD